MKKIIKVLEKVLFFTVALFCFSCKNEFVEENTSLVKISINPVIKEMQEGISPNISSSVLPDRNIYPVFETDSYNLKFVLTGSKDGDSPKEIGRWNSLNQLQNADILIEPGIWNLTLSAYASGFSFEDSSLCYKAVTDVELTDNTEIEFKMSLIENCQIQGSFSFDIYYPSDNGWSVTANLLTAAYEPTAYSFNLDSYSSYSHDNSYAYINLVPGVYVLQLKFVYRQSQSEEISTTYKNIVFTILPGLTSSYNKTYTSDELNKQYHIYYENCDTSYENYDQLPQSYKLMQKVIIPPLVRQNYIFNGWYYYGGSSGSKIYLEKNEDGNYVFVTTEANSNNLTFYADWILIGDQDSDGFGWTLENGVLTLSGEGLYPYSIDNYPSWKTAVSLVIEEGITGFKASDSYYGYIGFYNRNNDAVALKSVTLPSTFENICNDCFYGCTELEEINIPDGVTSIGNSSFSGCTSLKTINITDTLKSIGEDAFNGCTSLEEINIPSTIETLEMYAFQNSGIKSATLNTASIPYRVFYNCTSLENLTIGENVTSVTQSAFEGCSALNEVTLKGNIASSDGEVFSRSGIKKAVIETNINTDYLFRNSKTLTEVEFKEGVTSVYGFEGCTALSKVTIPDTVTAIGNSSFSGCTSLEQIQLPETVTSIGNSSFSGCTSLTTINMPSSLISIGEDAFNGCTSLEEINIPSTIETLKNYAFRNSGIKSATLNTASIPYGVFYNCTSLENLTIGENVTSVNAIAFEGCSALNEVTLKGNIATPGSEVFSRTGIKKAVIETNINTDDLFRNSKTLAEVEFKEGVTSVYGFEGCTALSKVSIPDTVTSIGNYAFQNCTSLSEIVLPDTVTAINKYAFDGCTSLTTINMTSSLISIGEYAFRGCAVPSITLPDTVQTVYQNAFRGWKPNQTITLQWNSNDSNHLAPKSDYEYYGTHAKYRDGVYAWGGWIPDDEGVLYITGTDSWALNYNIRNSRYNNEVIGIDSSAFPSNITSVVVEEGITGLTYYGNDTDIPNVTSITLPSTLTSIGANTFANFSGITEITIPESVTTIGDYAFKNCSRLTSVSIPSDVTSISKYTFTGCSSLGSVVLPDTVSSINEYAFNGCSSLASISIPEGITTISSNTFYNCTSLDTVVLPSTLKTIGENCFYNCSKLTTIELPFGLRTIADYAFYKCSSVPEITIPATVTSIGSYAFDYWTDSQTIYLDWASSDSIPRTIPESAFGYEGVIVINTPSTN